VWYGGSVTPITLQKELSVEAAISAVKKSLKSETTDGDLRLRAFDVGSQIPLHPLEGTSLDAAGVRDRHEVAIRPVCDFPHIEYSPGFPTEILVLIRKVLRSYSSSKRPREAALRPITL
jgi:hypothetical protein